ncbi:hypothetical protein CY0110_16967 [Crocosphaera chwakensis CCY0110]|uniref:Uncharacterized protein n=1 Tax=Crocosphaera chwakensis CCY0110 TaxID=391612 RepID=A3II75_9CHRO|nr:hypothetical protein CY0110_16967 [Crocosphaera chwakensis CCY0110]
MIRQKCWSYEKIIIYVLSFVSINLNS